MRTHRVLRVENLVRTHRVLRVENLVRTHRVLRMNVWRATPDEAATVARLIWEFGNWFSGSAPPEDEIRTSVERIMSGEDGEYLLGGSEDDAQGVLQLRFRWSVWKGAPDAWLEDLYVRDEARGGGVGRALVEAALERARERGAKRIELDVQEDNEPAMRLYEACGFDLQPKGPVPTRFISRPL